MNADTTDRTDQRSGAGPEWLGYVPMTVDAHVRSRSVLEVILHPEEERAVVSIAGSNNATVHLFTPRAQLARLIEALSAGLAKLDAQMDTSAQIASETGTAGAESAA